ncbi:MAG: hypothetical protein NVSMB1_06740 [Polyangiales bacterium]
MALSRLLERLQAVAILPDLHDAATFESPCGTDASPCPLTGNGPPEHASTSFFVSSRREKRKEKMSLRPGASLDSSVSTVAPVCNKTRTAV